MSHYYYLFSYYLIYNLEIVERKYIIMNLIKIALNFNYIYIYVMCLYLMALQEYFYTSKQWSIIISNYHDQLIY